MFTVKRPSTGTLLGATALFVALSGPSYAADAVKSAVKKIDGSTIKTGTVTSAQLKNGTVSETDLSAALKAKVAKVGAPGAGGAQGAAGPAGPKGDTGPAGAAAVITPGSITTADLADGAVVREKIGQGVVTNGKLADGAVNSEKIQDGTIQSADISSIDASKITNQIPGTQLGRNVVRGADIQTGGFTTSQCKTWSYTAEQLGYDGFPQNVIATPVTNPAFNNDDPYPVGLSLSAAADSQARTVRLQICNLTGAPVADAKYAVNFIIL